MADLKPVCHPAPAALVEHCSRRTAPAPSRSNQAGTRDKSDVTALLTWLAEHDAFTDYESWFQVGMALALEYGDDGFSLWELCHDSTVTPDVAASKWASFSQEPDAHSVTLATFLDRAHKLGWRGQVRKSTTSMFGDVVANIAANAGATLASQGIPMDIGQAELARIGGPILQDFLNSTINDPSRPSQAVDYPELDPANSGHGLFEDMQTALLRIFALAEIKPFKASRVEDVLIVLGTWHAELFEQVCRRLRTMGHRLPDQRLKRGIAAMTENVQRVTVTGDKWEYDAKGVIESDNPDNVEFLLGYCRLDIRWNGWLDRMQIQGGNEPNLRFSEWTDINDAAVAALLTRAKRSKTRFRPAKDFLWDTLETLARKNTQDPVLDALDELAHAWDRQPRLITWLTRYCGTPCDQYHQAVGKLIIGGMVQRARNAGCKFDFMPVFYGRQGTGKSSMAQILSLRPEWFTDNVLLGDAAKELVLSLAGKMVVEIGEMGMRSNTNAAHVKAMISRQVDAGRTAYARSVSERPRRNIFIGTTNDEQPLTDPTGNRRFLPIRITQAIDLAGLAADIAQLVGEAAALEKAGQTFWLPQEVWGEAESYQEAARQASDIETLFADWFGETEFSQGAFVTVSDLVLLCDSTGRRNQGQLVHSIMKRLGFNEAVPYVDGKKTRVWFRSDRDMLPRHVPNLPRYRIDTSQGSPRVVLRQAAVVVPSRS